MSATATYTTSSSVHPNNLSVNPRTPSTECLNSMNITSGYPQNTYTITRVPATSHLAPPTTNIAAAIVAAAASEQNNALNPYSSASPLEPTNWSSQTYPSLTEGKNNIYIKFFFNSSSELIL